MKQDYLDKIHKDMTVHELAQLIMPILDLMATKEDLALTEKRLTRKIDQNYIHVNKRIDLLSEKVS